MHILPTRDLSVSIEFHFSSHAKRFFVLFHGIKILRNIRLPRRVASWKTCWKEFFLTRLARVDLFCSRLFCWIRHCMQCVRYERLRTTCTPVSPIRFRGWWLLKFISAVWWFMLSCVLCRRSMVSVFRKRREQNSKARDNKSNIFFY